jgi:hypothetical protein
MNEKQISESEPVCLRFKGAQHLYEKFIESCGPPRDSYFHMITYFDAFLFSYVSIEEMIDKDEKTKLNELDVFKFLKAARNITTHHSVLAAPNQAGDFERPFSRVINDGNTGIASAKLRVRIEKFREMFTIAMQKYPRGAKGFQESEAYLLRIETTGADSIFIEEVMLEGLESAASILGCDT